jgi:hypothetical protein
MRFLAEMTAAKTAIITAAMKDEMTAPMTTAPIA